MSPDARFTGNGTSFYRDIVPQTFIGPDGTTFTLDNNQWTDPAPPYFATSGYDLTTERVGVPERVDVRTEQPEGRLSGTLARLVGQGDDAGHLGARRAGAALDVQPCRSTVGYWVV